jgi:SAM-dependent methyltransferase
VLGNDKKHQILGLIKKHGGSAKTASDYGCGPGKFLPMLAENFGRVNAIDISYKFIAQAKEKYKHLSNIKYQTTDLAKDGLKLKKTHFALSVNMLIMPALACRVRIFDVMAKHLLKGGHLAMVVPSLESAELTNFRLIEWNLRIGIKPASAVREAFGDAEKPDYLNRCQGVVPVDGVPTKHYLKEELAAELSSRGMRVMDIGKIEYLWNTEFDRPPKWMKEPYPWDWIVTGEKR